MAQTIKIKRSTTTATPSTLSAGELAYSDNSDKLFIGAPADSAVIAIGGKVYIDMLDHTAGTLTADSAIVVDSNSKIDKLLTGNIRINNTTNQIDTASGNLILNPAASLDIDAGTIDLSTQATEFSIIDNSATAFTVSQGINNYITLDTTNSAEKVKFGQQVEFSGAYTLPTGDGSSGQALITDGSGSVSFTTISTELDIAADTGTDTISLVNDTLTFTGTDPVQTSINASTNTLSISVDNATSSTKGIASFSGSYFTITSGDVAIDDATTSTKGIASFATADFAVSSGAVSIKTGGVSNAQLANSTTTLGSSTLTLGSTTTDITGLTSLAVDNLTFNGNEITSTNTNGDISLNPNGSGVIDVNNSRISNITDPTQAQDAATKAYVDAVKQSLDIKDSVRVATTANITIASDLNVGDVIDGVTLADGDRVLVKNQTTASQNGIYVAGSSPVRSADANASAEVTSGMFVFVEEGTANADNGFVLSTDGTITLDTTNLTFTQFSGAGQIVAGDALSKSGNTLNVNDDNITLEVNNDNLRIKGITATAIGDLLIGAATNGGYSRLVKPSSDDALLTMGTAGTASWTTTLDGGTF
jgi:hypothetical protein